jgi:hypothetical protein
MVEDCGMAGDGSDRRWARFFIGLTWGLTTVAVLAALIFAGMLAGASAGFDVLPRLDGGRTSAGPLAVGAAVGLIAGLVVGHRGRGWVQALRLRRLRRDGVVATGTVRGCSRRYIANPRGPGTSVYSLTVTWHDPALGPQSHTREYRFWGHGDAAFEECVPRGGRVTLRYPTGRPHRFIVDIPYAPTMADQFI